MLKKNFNFQSDILNSVNDNFATEPTLNACLNANGKYEIMRFVLRLSPRNHELMEMFETNSFKSDEDAANAIQAFSTYIHETIHWWQHVGSTSRLLYSLSYLAQGHSNMGALKSVLESIGAKKSLKGYADKVLLEEGDVPKINLLQPILR